MLSIYCGSCVLNQAIWIAFAPIASSTSRSFEVSSFWVDLLAVIFPILFLPGIFLSSHFLSSYSLRGNMNACAALTFAGCVLRVVGAALLAVSSSRLDPLPYVCVLLGQAIVALAQPFVLNLPGVIAGRWFGSNERDLATTLGTLSNIVGQALGQALSPLCVGSAEATTEDFLVLTGHQLVVAAVVLVWTYACFVDRPPSPPNYAETKIARGASLLRLWRDLVADRDFLVLLVVFGLGLAMFNAFLTTLSSFLEPCGYDENDAGNLGAVVVAGGLAGAGVVGAAMDALHAYRPALKATVWLAVGTIAATCALTRPHRLTELYVVFAALGACMIATLPVVIENALECTYPVSEEVSVGLLFLVGNTISIGFTYLMQALIDKNDCGSFPSSPARAFLVSVGAVLAIGVMFYRGEYKRLKEEERHRVAMERNETAVTSLTWTPPLREAA